MNLQNTVDVLDGFSGCGKSSLGRHLAKSQGKAIYDAGASFRAVTAANKLTKDDIYNQEYNADLIKKEGIFFVMEEDHERVFVGSLEVTDMLHNPEISKLVPIVGAQHNVRDAIREIEINLANEGNIVICGRNIGRYVFPKKDFPNIKRVWVDVPLDKRAQWRLNQLQETGHKLEWTNVFHDLEKRDIADMTREYEPVKVPNTEEGYIFFRNGDYEPKEAKEILLSLIRPSNLEILEIHRSLKEEREGRTNNIFRR